MVLTCTTVCGGDGRIQKRSGVTWPLLAPNMLLKTQKPMCLMRSKYRPEMTLDQDLNPMWSLDILEKTVSGCTKLWGCGSQSMDKCNCGFFFNVRSELFNLWKYKMLLFVGFSHYIYYIYYTIAAKVTKAGVTSRMSFKSSHVKSMLIEKQFPQNTRALIIMLN